MLAGYPLEGTREPRHNGQDRVKVSTFEERLFLGVLRNLRPSQECVAVSLHPNRRG